MMNDLTVGKPEAVLWKFCLPLFGSIVFQQLYNIADSFVAGKFIGENALAAVGNSYEVTLIFIAFAFGCNMGCSVIVSQFFGAKKYENMKTAVYTAMITSAVACILLMVVGLVFCDSLLGIINTPTELMKDSKLYLDIYILGLPFVFFYNIATGIFSALGDSKTPFYFLAVSSTSNIVVDIFVVFQRLAGIKTEKVLLFSFDILKRIMTVAVPSILQQSFISVGNIIIQGTINGFGSSVMAGYSAAVKLNNLVITSFTTLGNGISNYTAQNIGAGKMLRIKEGFMAGIKMVWMLSVPLFALYFFVGKWILYAFIDEPTVLALQTGINFLRILSPFYFIISMKFVADGILRGAGMMGKFMAATFLDLILRVGLAILLSHTSLGETGIWCAWPMGWTIATFLSLMFYKEGKWMKNEKKC